MCFVRALDAMLGLGTLDFIWEYRLRAFVGLYRFMKNTLSEFCAGVGCYPVYFRRFCQMDLNYLISQLGAD